MKRTYNLDDAVEQGVAPSQDGFVQKALERELRRLRDQRDEVLWAASLHDAEFQAELRDIERAFAHADLETWPPY